MRIVVGCIVLMGCARVDEPAEARSNLREWHSRVVRYAGKDGSLLGALGLQEVGSDGRTTGFVDAGHRALVVSSCDGSIKQVNKSCLSKTVVIDAHL
jgi:hypothetical protein